MRAERQGMLGACRDENLIGLAADRAQPPHVIADSLAERPEAPRIAVLGDAVQGSTPMFAGQARPELEGKELDGRVTRSKRRRGGLRNTPAHARKMTCSPRRSR